MGTVHDLPITRTRDKIGDKSSGGGGGMLEARVAKLEADVDNIKTMVKDIKDDVREIKRDAKGDFRLLFGAIIFVALGLAGMMAKGFGWM